MIETEQATNLLGVPTVWMALLAHARAQGKKLTLGQEGGDRRLGVSAAHDRGVGERARRARDPRLGHDRDEPARHHRRAAAASTRRCDDAERFAFKCKQGRPVFGVDLRLVDDDGAVIAHDGKTSGHLQVRGPWVAGSYFKRERDEAHQDGWFYTGDIATIDPDGYMQITDRSKDVIKSGGEWVSSIDLENAAMSHPCVQHAAAIGVPHPEVAGAAAADRREGARQGRRPQDELQQFLETKLVKWWLPDAIEFIDALPLGATGKVLKRELRTKFADYKLPEAAARPS